MTHDNFMWLTTIVNNNHEHLKNQPPGSKIITSFIVAETVNDSDDVEVNMTIDQELKIPEPYNKDTNKEIYQETMHMNVEDFKLLFLYIYYGFNSSCNIDIAFIPPEDHTLGGFEDFLDILDHLTLHKGLGISITQNRGY